MAKSKDTWKIYKDKAGKYRWRRTASNKEIVGASTQGYSTRQSCKENAKRNGAKESDL